MVYNIYIKTLTDDILAIILQTPQDVLYECRDRFKARRLAINLTQEGLAQRAGMSWGSLKRFERTGQISFESLLNLALVLDCLNDFNSVCTTSIHKEGITLDTLLTFKKTSKRGQIK
jgi:transcriptional regulator with XRE-family HTH domain